MFVLIVSRIFASTGAFLTGFFVVNLIIYIARMTPVHSPVDDITVAAVLGVILAFFIAQKASRLLDKYFSER